MFVVVIVCLFVVVFVCWRLFVGVIVCLFVGVFVCRRLVVGVFVCLFVEVFDKMYDCLFSLFILKQSNPSPIPIVHDSRMSRPLKQS